MRTRDRQVQKRPIQTEVIVTMETYIVRMLDAFVMHARTFTQGLSLLMDIQTDTQQEGYPNLHGK